MNIVDAVIYFALISGIIRGFQVGFIRQLGSTTGFVGGLMLSSRLSPILAAHLSHDTQTRSLLSAIIVICLSVIFMLIGEWVGIRIKLLLRDGKLLNRVDNNLGSLLSVATFAFGVWFGIALVALLPNGPIQQTIRSSYTYNYFDHHFPPASQLLSSLNKFIDPNSLPQVFSGREPSPSATAILPSVDSFGSVIDRAKAATVQIQGLGCGGVVDGSGFVYSNNHVATNAHVVAGINHPKVYDKNGTHDAKVVYFDSSNDIAILYVPNLDISPLPIDKKTLANGEVTLVVGYPGGGKEQTQTAAVLETLNALGRDIYGQSKTVREVYVLQSHVIPGNSGGPIIDHNGVVRGVIFATSTTYSNVGYALTMSQIYDELITAESQTNVVDTGVCSTM